MKTNKQRLEELQNIFEQLDEDYGFGPSEPIEDENKIDEYIKNFMYKVQVEYPILYEDVAKLDEDFGGKSYLELLNEV